MGNDKKQEWIVVNKVNSLTKFESSKHYPPILTVIMLTMFLIISLIICYIDTEFFVELELCFSSVMAHLVPFFIILVFFIITCIRECKTRENKVNEYLKYLNDMKMKGERGKDEIDNIIKYFNGKSLNEIRDFLHAFNTPIKKIKNESYNSLFAITNFALVVLTVSLTINSSLEQPSANMINLLFSGIMWYFIFLCVLISSTDALISHDDRFIRFIVAIDSVEVLYEKRIKEKLTKIM